MAALPIGVRSLRRPRSPDCVWIGSRLLLDRRDCRAGVRHCLEHDLSCDPFHDLRQRSSSPASFRRPDGGGPVQGGQERGQRLGRRGAARGRSTVGGRTWHPGGDDPRMGVSHRGLTEALGNGNGQGQQRGKDGEPGVLLEQQCICRLGLPGKPDSEVVAESPQLVVPTACPERERAVSQVWLLIPQEISDELGSRLHLGLLAEPIEDGQDRGRYQASMICLLVIHDAGSPTRTPAPERRHRVSRRRPPVQRLPEPSRGDQDGLEVHDERAAVIVDGRADGFEQAVSDRWFEGGVVAP